MRVVRGGLRAVACASALLLAGCGSSTQGSPVTGESPAMVTTTAASEPEEPFDPCTIPKDAVTASGLDVSTERADFAGITTYPGWKNCAWDGPTDDPWYFLIVQSSTNALDQFLRSPQNINQLPLQVGPRAAVQYNVADEPPEGCRIALDVTGNLIVFILHKIGSKDLLVSRSASTPMTFSPTCRSEGCAQ